MLLGATFSHHELNYLKLNLKKALQAYHSLNFAWVRLAAYWSEIELQKNNFNFSPLDQLITSFDNQKTNIVLCVGLKAPRWPEYYLPNWLDFDLPPNSQITTAHQYLLKRTLIFLEKTIAHYKAVKSLKVWQIENEPLDRAGPHRWRLHSDFLQQEINLTRQLDPSRPILLNLWGNELTIRNHYHATLPLAGIIGFDLYPKHAVPILTRFHKYLGPFDSPQTLTRITQQITSQNKKFWITELQAEPWEPNHWKNLTTYPSFLPTQLQKNFDYAKQFNPEVVIFWGFEFWLFQKLNANPAYWQALTSLLRKH